ncbi:MAG: hypothetical protein ACFE9L_12565 [Candidatus Hodarchaeota archaeon]
MTYSKDELNQLLKRHSGQDSDCGCNCPFTGHSIIMLVQFVAIENNFPEWLVTHAINLYKQIAAKGCIVGDRKITAAAIVYLVYVLQGEEVPVNQKRLTQERLAEIFFITEVGIRNRYKHIFKFFGFDKTFWDTFREALPSFGQIPAHKREKRGPRPDDMVKRCLLCGYMECRCGKKHYGKITRRESQQLQARRRRELEEKYGYARYW